MSAFCFCAAAETPSQSVGRSVCKRGRFDGRQRKRTFSVSVAIVGVVVVITIVRADKAEQIEGRRRGELQKRKEAVRGWQPKSDHAGIVNRQFMTTFVEKCSVALERERYRKA